jgi:hypothetical protein
VNVEQEADSDVQKESEFAIRAINNAVRATRDKTSAFMNSLMVELPGNMPGYIAQATVTGAVLAVVKKYEALIPKEAEAFVAQAEKICGQSITVVEEKPAPKLVE